ncbi:probable methyltransferase PMT17 isoform X3 [Cryptomeria japonica]|uniref:probable methyltransferase PMT17 isoform X3 n=1 Tax=Cryptomeria japonica TaxID=3369 RepID=UPI0027D9E79E|nr:probable methyltransferase PMT17 isoform X3 [Cryptomeria japonica]XP_059063542.1 probable methyltransferase PMT17 isoform X3 [Cryptomeria japonica]
MGKEYNGSPKLHLLADSKNRRIPWYLGVFGLCVLFYFLGSWKNARIPSTDMAKTNLGVCNSAAPKGSSSPSPSSSSVKLDFDAHHTVGSNESLTEGKMTFKPCSMKYSEYTPCQDPVRSRKYSREKLMYRERHCPAKNDVLKCLIPAPPGYKNPFSCPRSRDYAWFANVPYRELTIEKAVQNWIQVEGDKFRFPGGGTMFPRGADAYIDDINNLIPLTDGSIRTAIDTGCGETQLYCCTHKVPVCGDCICFPEHSAREVRTYAEWMVDSSCSFLPKCSFCLQILTHSSHSVTQLGCLQPYFYVGQEFSIAISF